MSRRLLIALAAVAVVSGLNVVAHRDPTWQLFFSWPSGGTWSNAIEQAEGAALVGLVTWVGKDHIGAKLAAWWARHHGPHAIAQQREALRQHEAAKGAAGEDHPES